MNQLRHQKYKNKQLNNTRVLKVKNSSLELERDFKLVNISINDMDKLKKQKTSKEKKFYVNTWYDWYYWLNKLFLSLSLKKSG